MEEVHLAKSEHQHCQLPYFADKINYSYCDDHVYDSDCMDNTLPLVQVDPWGQTYELDQ